MTAAMAMPGNTAETFLVHFFGTGLADDRYVVERFRARADGDIVPAPAEALAATQQLVRLTAVQQAREYMDRAADPSQRAVIAGMLEDGGESTCGAVANPMSQAERKKGKASRVSDTDTEDSPARHRPEFLDTGEAAALLGLVRRTLARYRARDVGPAYHRFHGRIVYTRTDLMTWALTRRQTTRESD